VTSAALRRGVSSTSADAMALSSLVENVFGPGECTNWHTCCTNWYKGKTERSFSTTREGSQPARRISVETERIALAKAASSPVGRLGRSVGGCAVGAGAR
jgi:hypothetical protein